MKIVNTNKVPKSFSKKKILKGLTQAFSEVQLIKSGKLKARPINELLNDL
jgi:hypothetical protein